MSCQWQMFISLLPPWMREKIDKLGKNTLLELRMRLRQPPELVTKNGSIWLDRCVVAEDLLFVINIASKYSPWSSGGISNGFITADGGHRIGICGETVMKGLFVHSFSKLTSLCIRVARDHRGIAPGLHEISGSILIIGPPGYGKTTLLRDLIRQRSNLGTGTIAVIDEKNEIFPSASSGVFFDPGKRTDVISGCSKRIGIEVVLKNMSPTTIAVDEITSEEDSDALLFAGWCGVDLIATAHARQKSDLYSRKIYQKLIENHLFDTLFVLRKDKSWYQEELKL